MTATAETGAGASWRAPRTLWLAPRLALRELRAGLGGFRVFVAALMLGVAAIAAVGTVSEATRAGLARDARTILGGDVDVSVAQRPLTAEQRAVMTATGTLSETWRMRAMAYNDGNGERALVAVKAVDGNYPLYGRVELQGGGDLAGALARRDGRHGVAIDPVLIGRLGIAPGGRLRLGGAEFEVRALITREPDRIIRFASFGPRVFMSLAAASETGLIRPGSLVHYHHRLALPDAADPQAAAAALKARFPDAGWRVRALDQAAPGFQRFLGRATQFLTLVGLTALLVGGVGIANAVRAFLERRMATIATMKCLGASGDLVFAVYLLQVLLLAAVAILGGLLIGVAAPLLVGPLLRGLLPFDLPLVVHWRPLTLAAGFGILTTICFTLWPLGKSREVRAADLFRALVLPPAGLPRRRYLLATTIATAAIAALTIAGTGDPRLGTWFAGGALAAFAVFGLLATGVTRLARSLPAPASPAIRMALQNLHRPGAPTRSVILSLGLGISVLVIIALVESNLNRQIAERIPDRAPAYFFIDIQPHQADSFTEIARATPGIDRIDRTPMVRGRVTRIAGAPVEQVEVHPDVEWVVRGDRGLTYAAAPPENAEIVAGEWWPADYAGPPLISMDAEAASGFGVGLGDSVTLNILGRDITATIANLRRVEWATLAMNFVFIFAPGTLEAAPHGVIAAVYADGEAAAETAQRRVTDRFANISAIRVKDALDNAGRILTAVGLAIRLTAMVAVLAGILVLAGAIMAGHRRRVADAIILKVLGASRRRILGIYALEYGLLALVTILIAAPVGALGAFLIVTRLMRAEFALDPGAVVATLAASLAVIIGLGLAGTWRALGEPAAPALRQG